MANLSQKLAEMHRRLSENAQEEQALVRALNAALNHVDEKLMQEIRSITAQHEARRAVIMNELQLLAGRLCSFPLTASEPVAAIEDAHHQLPHNGNQNGTYANGHSNGHANCATHAPGNWRIAAQNIQDDLDFFTDPPTASH
jgi:hypothetical protein